MDEPKTTNWAICNRRSTRYRILHSEGDVVEFEHPGGGQWCFPLLDLSVEGLSFALGDVSPPLQAGLALDRAVLLLGDRRIRGDLVIAHVTQSFGAGDVCGARFRPASADDGRELQAFLDTADVAT